MVLSVGLLALLALAWAGQWAFQFGQPRALGGVLLAVAGLALCVVWFTAARRSEAPPPRRQVWLAAALCALGVAFRVVHFYSVPAGMNHDAAFNGMYALHVLQGADYTPYVSAAWGRETLFMYLCAPLVAWLGNQPEPIQLAATLVGIATLPLFYLFARALCGPRVALIGLAFLAVSGWHVIFSRVGWRMLMVPPFELLALWGLWRALESGARRWWVLCGCGAALAIYTYDAGRLIPLMVAALFAARLLIERVDVRRRLLGGFVVLAVFVIVGAPMLWYAVTHFDQFKGRAAHLATAEQGRAGLPAPLAALAMFNYRGNGNDFFIDEPLLEPLTGVLFLFGLFVLLLPRRAAAASHALPASDSARRRGTACRARFASDTGGRDQGTACRAPTPLGSKGGRREYVRSFILIGLAVALLPGFVSIPNGNRCIAALPFVYLIAALGADALAAAIVRPFADPQLRRRAAAGLLALLVIAAGVETYREFLGAARRRMLGFGVEATAAGQYLRRFGEDYSRYVVAEDWQEYTLAYLSYNGGGTPLENHYVLGRRLADIEAQINRYGRKGLVFVADLKDAGREAIERLKRQFADHRIEDIPAARLGGVHVARALIVEPQGAARTAAWSNSSRALALGGEAEASALHCFAPIGDADGVSARLQLMRTEVTPGAPGGGVRFVDECPPSAAAQVLAVDFTADGLALRGDGAATALPAARLEAGRWYLLDVAVRADGTVEATVDGTAVAAAPAAGARRPVRIAGVELSAPAGGQLFVDDLAVVPGVAGIADPRWARLARGDLPGGFAADFETMPFGRVAESGGWRLVAGATSVLASPAGAAAPAPPPGEGGNAFDGGKGSGAGQFNEPVGIAADPSGRLYVADRLNHRIQVFDRDGNFVRAWGEPGNKPGQFKEPHDVAADAEFVYVADTWNQRVQVFDHDGAHVFTISGAPSLSSPRGVFVKDGRIYIAEAGGARVSVYDRAAALQQSFGAKAAGAPGALREAVDVAIDPQGDVWVVNSGNNRLERFAADGTPRGGFAVEGWEGPRLKESYLAIDAAGMLYLGDWQEGVVRRFRADGSELEPLGSGIKKPSGIVVDGDRLLVAERGENVVRVIPLN